MDVIRAGLGISKTIRNAARLREIVLVFAHHGFEEFISQSVRKSVPRLPKARKNIKREMEGKDWGKILGHRLRLCFEELGPAFIKLGQLLASREEMFDRAFIDEMKLLQDKVRPVPFSKVRANVEKSLGSRVEDVFSRVEEEPLGTASIGAVYGGVLKNGEEAVLKVRKPGIEKTMALDFSLLNFLASQAEKVSHEVRALGVAGIVHNFTLSLMNELNFSLEASNAGKFGRALEKHDRENIFYVPKFYGEFSGEDLLVMERLRGEPFGAKPEVGDALRRGTAVLVRTFFHTGRFHADLHGGNLFYLDNGKIGMVDFGLMTVFSGEERRSLLAIIYAVYTLNYEHLVTELMDIADYENVPDMKAVSVDMRRALGVFMGGEDLTAVIKIILDVLRKRQIFLPSEWYSFFRGLIVLDGAGRSLGVDLELYALLEEEVGGGMKRFFGKNELVEEAAWGARDVMSFGKSVPRYLKVYFKSWSKRGYAHELVLKGYAKPLRDIARSVVFLGFSLLAGVFVLAGVLFIDGEIPRTTWIFWGLGAVFLAGGLKKGL